MKDWSLCVAGVVTLDRDWDSPLVPAGFTLSRTFKEISVMLGDLIHYTSVGVELITSPVVTTVPTYRRYHRFSYAFFGTALIKIAASVVPMTVKYNLRKDGELYSIDFSIPDDYSTDVCGVDGLTVSVSDIYACYFSGLTAGNRFQLSNSICPFLLGDVSP